MTIYPGLIHNCVMNRTITVKAYAKVNLLLEVLGRRADGYHELAGVMQRISLCDIVAVSAKGGAAGGSVSAAFSCPVPFRNTARRAAELFIGDKPYDIDIRIKKNIPSEAGLGGASADAAAVLKALNALFEGTELQRTEAELAALGLKVGADVPFCLAGGCAAARGVGEVLDPLPVPKMTIVVLKGERGVSTPALFKLYDETVGKNAGSAEGGSGGVLESMISAIKAGDIRAVGAAMLNALQPAALTIAPEIAAEISLLNRFGALGACMTGSGAAVIGLFENEAAAKPLMDHMESIRPDGLFRAVCSTAE